MLPSASTTVARATKCLAVGGAGGAVVGAALRAPATRVRPCACRAGAEAGAPWALVAVVSGSAAAVAAATASAASPAVLRMGGAFRRGAASPSGPRQHWSNEAATARVTPSRGSAEVEEGVEADGEARVVADRAHAGQHARGERDPVERVVPDGERLPRRAEEDLLVRHEAAHPQAVDAYAVDVGAARAVEAGGVASGIGALPASRRAAAISSAVRRAVPDGRVGLVGVVQLDDLDRLEERRGLRRRSASSGSRRCEKLGAISTPTPGASASHASSWSSRSWSKPVVPTTAWMPCSMQKRRLSITTSGWVKSTTTCGARAGELLEVVAGVDRGHQLGVGRRLDGPADLGADLAARAQHADPDRGRCGRSASGVLTRPT